MVIKICPCTAAQCSCVRRELHAGPYLGIDILACAGSWGVASSPEIIRPSLPSNPSSPHLIDSIAIHRQELGTRFRQLIRVSSMQHSAQPPRQVSSPPAWRANRRIRPG